MLCRRTAPLELHHARNVAEDRCHPQLDELAKLRGRALRRTQREVEHLAEATGVGRQLGRVDTSENDADFLTKAILKLGFERAFRAIGLATTLALIAR